MNIKHLLWRWGSSFGVFLLSAGVLLGVNRLHASKTAKTASEMLVHAVPVSLATLIFPDAVRTEVVGEEPSGWTLVYGTDGNRLGMVVNTSPLMDFVAGYAGPTPVLLGLTLDGIITDLQLLDNTETRSFVRRVVSSGYLDQWLGLSYEEAQVAEFDAVTRATMTCDAIATSIRGRLAQAGTDPASIPTTDHFVIDPINWQTLTIIFLVLLGVALSLWSRFWQKWHVFKPARYLVLTGSVIILGFTSATMFSMTLLEALAKSGRVPTNMDLIVLVLLAVLVPVFTRKNVYCHYVCPFGGLQELTHRLSPLKWIKPRKSWQRLRPLRYVLLALLAISVLTDWHLKPDMQEPFTAFHWVSAGWIPMILAGLALIFSLLGINRPWCTYCCTSGALLDLLRGKKHASPIRGAPAQPTDMREMRGAHRLNG